MGVRLIGVVAAVLLATASINLLMSTVTPVEAKVGPCLLCTIVAGLIQQIAIDQNLSVQTAVNNMCTDITKDLPILSGVCELALDLLFQAKLQQCVSDGTSPDNCCHDSELNMCVATDTCVLFKKWPPAVPLAERHLGAELIHLAQGRPVYELSKQQIGSLASALGVAATYLGDGLQQYLLHKGDTVDLSTTPDVPASLKKSPVPVVDHLPLVDLDGDRFSTIGSLRGFHWRGKDCDDLAADIYPGREQTAYGASVDHNCNGIVGTDPNTGKSYEELYCAGTQPRGYISLGDSVTAHFRIPDYWFRPAEINASTYTNLLPVLEDEADWPLCGWATGFAPDSMCPYSKLSVDSLALRLRANNLCNHRDYQNIGVNGARTGSMAPPGGIVTTIHNRTGVDQPATVVYALVGNDVCNGHPTFSTMTTPAEFETNVLAALDYLDAALAPNSHVIFVGLADGRILFNTLQNETHPIGVPYPDFYDYLNCWETSPCWGWMNINETVRDLTWTDHANVLNQIYPKIISEKQYQNFDMYYVPPDFQGLIDKWVASGGHARDLIEPVDGFHPSQTGNILLAEQMWADLQANFSQAIGPVNPNNAAILAQFGDQGGYGLPTEQQ